METYVTTLAALWRCCGDAVVEAPCEHWRRLPVPARTGLATGTVGVRTPSQSLTHHGGLAAATLQSLAPVGAQLAGEEPGGTLDIDVEGIEARATDLKGPAHDLSGGLEDPGHHPRAETGSRAQAVHPGLPQALVGVDVTDARDDPLV